LTPIRSGSSFFPLFFSLPPIPGIERLESEMKDTCIHLFLFFFFSLGLWMPSQPRQESPLNQAIGDGNRPFLFLFFLFNLPLSRRRKRGNNTSFVPSLPIPSPSKRSGARNEGDMSQRRTPFFLFFYSSPSRQSFRYESSRDEERSLRLPRLFIPPFKLLFPISSL